MIPVYALALALALSAFQVAATEYKWFSDYACQHPVNGACISSAPNECCTPPYPPGINSVYISATDVAGILGWTMYANGYCHDPVKALTHSAGPIPGSGCFNAANAAVGSIKSGEEL